MKRIVPIALGSITLLASISASALPPDKKVVLGLRSGYALPFGDALSAGGSGIVQFKQDVHMKDLTSGMIPIWVDAGYMVTPEIMVGAYFQYGFVSIKKRDTNGTVGCVPTATCSAHDLRYGVQAQYHFGVAQSLDPWLGLGFGRETVALSSTQNGVESSGSLNGWEYLNLQGGLDIEVTPGFALGPFASFSFGQYSTVSTKLGNVDLDIDLPSAWHEWLTLGVKGTLGL